MTAEAALSAHSDPAPNRPMLMMSIMGAMVMTVLDQTIANVALPHMAGSVSASQDQIAWVLTSYIIAAAIMTPTTSWLADRFGRKAVFMVSIVGFTSASALCGAAQNLDQIVIFRVLQGASGAAMAPLSQAVMLDLYPYHRRGPVMALWSMGIMIAPICGPILGGWLTESFSWRWVFYINLPVGVLAGLGIWTFLHEAAPTHKVRFDIMGFALLSLMLGSFQLFLDRGQNNDWFQSPEILIEAALAALALVLFVIHTLTTDAPFLPLELFKDRNFAAATVLGLAVGLLVFSVMALLPPMVQTLLGYPVMTAGFLSTPRGLGSLVSMAAAGQLVMRVDPRYLITAGLSLFALSFLGMSTFNLQMDSWTIIWTGVVQGLGTGLVFTPMTMVAFASLAPHLRTAGTGLFTLVRNLGNSVGISIMEATFVRQAQVAHANLADNVYPMNPNALAALGGPEGMASPAALAALNGQVTAQASMVSYVDVFHLMFLTTLAAIPLVFLLRKPPAIQAIEEPISAE
jgi:DHA2 family multidrug resistance protein